MRPLLALALAVATYLAATPVAATPTADATLRIDPPVMMVADDGEFTLAVTQDATVPTSGAQVSVGFDPQVVQLMSVERASAYAAAPVFLPQDIEPVIREANTSGQLTQVAAAFTPPDAVPPGLAPYLLLRFRVVGCGETDISLPQGGPFNAQMISGQPDVYGLEVPVSTTSGHVTTCVRPDAVTASYVDIAPPATPHLGVPTGIVGAVIAVGLLAVIAWRMRQRGHDG